MKVLLLGLLAFGLTVDLAVAQAQSGPIDHVLIVVMENTDYSEALSQPFMGTLAHDGASLSNMNGVTHPSQGNYVGMVAGDKFNVIGDGIYDLDVRHLGDLLEAKGKTWKVYAEAYPGNCFLDATASTYARKHVPFLSFTNISGDPQRCNQHIVNADQLAIDVKNGTVPNYSLYIPDLNNDGHDTGAVFADQWLSRVMGPLIKNPDFMKNTLFILTFDESESYFGNQIYTAFYGPMVQPGSLNSDPLTHYNVLRTIEDFWQLGDLGQNDALASPIRGIWK
jgi:hypothetical protein